MDWYWSFLRWDHQRIPGASAVGITSLAAIGSLLIVVEIVQARDRIGSGQGNDFIAVEDKLKPRASS
jgi:hypothetical protein